MVARFRLPNLPHQQKEFDQFRRAKARALLWQMRTGKSKACIDLACDLFERGEIDRVLVLAPNNVHIGWVTDQIPKHVWDGLNHRARFWSSKEAAKKDYGKQLDLDVLRPKNFEGLLFYTMNSEGMRYPRPKKSMELFIAGAKKGVLLIADESQDFKRAGSTRGRLARAIAKKCKYKRILTGSGFDNSPLNAWGQFEILQPEALGFKTYGAFENHYAIKGLRKMGSRQFQVVEGYRDLESLQASIGQWSSVVLRSDVEGLPELNHSKEVFELTDEQEKLYNTLKKKLIVPDGPGVSVNKAFEGGVLGMKLLQVTSGFFVDENTDLHELKTNPRKEIMRRIIEEHIERKAKLIVWCRFIYDVEVVSALFEELGADYVQFYGAVTSGDREKNRIKFMEDENCLGFVGTPKAGGRGLNLSAAQTIVWYSRDYDLEFKRQADERATHVGGTSIDVIDLVALNTVDVSVVEALEEKLSISEVIDRTGLQAFLEGQTLAFEQALEL